MSEWYFRKKYHNIDGSRSHSTVLFVDSKQKIKMKTQNIMVYSYPLKVSSTQNKGVSFFSGSCNLVLNLHVWGKFKFFR